MSTPGGDIRTDGRTDWLTDQPTKLREFHMLYGTKKGLLELFVHFLCVKLLKTKSYFIFYQLSSNYVGAKLESSSIINLESADVLYTLWKSIFIQNYKVGGNLRVIEEFSLERDKTRQDQAYLLLRSWRWIILVLSSVCAAPGFVSGEPGSQLLGVLW